MLGLLKLFYSAAPFKKSFFYAAPSIDSLDVNDTCKRLITKLNTHFVNGKILQLHTIHESNYTVIKLPRNGNSKAKNN